MHVSCRALPRNFHRDRVVHNPIHDGSGHRSLAKALIASGYGNLGRDDERSVLHSVIKEMGLCQCVSKLGLVGPVWSDQVKLDRTLRSYSHPTFHPTFRSQGVPLDPTMSHTLNHTPLLNCINETISDAMNMYSDNISLTYNQQVRGSSPLAPTRSEHICQIRLG